MSDGKIYLIDAISPFFSRRGGLTENWSKAPLAATEKKGRPRKGRFRKIATRFRRYLKRVKAYGYTAVSLDELCYLYLHPAYPAPVRSRIERYRAFLGRLIDAAAGEGLQVFMTSDVLFSNPVLEAVLEDDVDAGIDLLYAALEQVLDEFPALSGVILRFGESDGVDVGGFFHSRILIRGAEEGNRMLRRLQPLFEVRGRTLILRTWTPGAGEIGDLMWNPRTLDRLLDGIPPANLLLSLKYGESDFFRYLELSRQFERLSRAGYAFLAEFQARREYEGFGAWPSFIGWEYARYRDQLTRLPGFSGIQLWCQTGGWTGVRERTFLKGSSIWNELNTWVAIRLFRDGDTVSRAVRSFHRRFLRRGRNLASDERRKEARELLRFLKLSDRLVRKVLYIPGSARAVRYCFRMRVPPLLHLFWDTLTVTPLMRAAVRRGDEEDRGLSVHELGAVLDEMALIAGRLRLPYAADFHRDLFTLLFMAREALTARRPGAAYAALESFVPVFCERHGEVLHISLAPLERPVVDALLRAAARLLLRTDRRYRPVDRLLFSTPLRRFYAALPGRVPTAAPAFLDRRGMSLSELLR